MPRVADFLFLAAKARCHISAPARDDIAQDTAVNVGNQVGFIQVLPEYGEIAQVPDAGYGDKDVYKDNQHEKLKHIRVYYAE